MKLSGKVGRTGCVLVQPLSLLCCCHSKDMCCRAKAVDSLSVLMSIIILKLSLYMYLRTVSIKGGIADLYGPSLNDEHVYVLNICRAEQEPDPPNSQTTRATSDEKC